MASHVYLFCRTAVPDWDNGPANPVDARSKARRRQLADAIIDALPGAEESLLLRDPDERWVCVHASPLEVTVHQQYVHVRIPYWSEAELCRRGVPRMLRAIADVADGVAGYDFVEHGDQGLGIEADLDSIVEHVGGFGDSIAKQMAAQLGPGLQAPMRGSELAW